MNRNEVKRRQAQMVSVILFLINYLVFSYRGGFNGAAYLLVPLFVYWFFMILVNGSMINTLSRLIKLRLSKEQVKSCLKMERDALLFQVILAILPTLIMVLLAGKIANQLFSVPLSEMAIRIFGIAFFLRTITCTVLGIAKGENVELPCILTDILRQILLFAFQMTIVQALSGYGLKVSGLLGMEEYTGMYAGLGFALSLAASEVIVLIFGIVTYRKGRKNRKDKQESMRTTVSFGDNVKTLFGNRLVPMLVLLPVLLPMILGLLFVQKSANDGAEVVVRFGVMTVAALVIPCVLISLYCICMIPVCGKVVGFLRKDEQKYARNTFQNGVHVGTAKAFFYTAFVAVESYRIAGILFRNDTELTGKYLRLAAVFISFVCLSFYFAEILILTGKRVLVLLPLAILDVVFVLLLIYFLKKCDDGIVAFLYSICACAFLLVITLGTIVYKKLRISIDWILYIVLPIATAATTGIVCMLVDKLITPHLGDLVSFFLCYLISISLYWFLSLVLRGFNNSELEEIPGNRLVIALGQMLHAI